MVAEKVDPVRRWNLSIRSILVLMAVVGVLMGWIVGMNRASELANRDTDRVLGLTLQCARLDPSLQFLETTGSRPFGILGVDLTTRGRLKTPTGQIISITIDSHQKVFGGGSSRLTFEAMGRSEIGPVEDLDRGRQIDLRAMFPEAFQ